MPAWIRWPQTPPLSSRWPSCASSSSLIRASRRHRSSAVDTSATLLRIGSTSRVSSRPRRRAVLSAPTTSVGPTSNAAPSLCGAIGKLYRSGEKIILWICDYVATPGVEEDLSHALVTRGYFPGPVDGEGKPAPSLLIVGDGTGLRQNAEHKRHEAYSFQRLRADGWTVLPPMYHWKTRTGLNPLVRDSRAQMHTLFGTGQILISRRCSEPQPGFPSLVDSFRRAKARPDGGLEKKGHFQHGPDGVRYLAWRLLPRPKPKSSGGFDFATYEALRSIKFLSGGGEEPTLD
jgi:hypothetical protein